MVKTGNCFLEGQTREIPSALLPAWVANQKAGLFHLARSQTLPYN